MPGGWVTRGAAAASCVRSRQGRGAWKMHQACQTALFLAGCTVDTRRGFADLAGLDGCACYSTPGVPALARLQCWLGERWTDVPAIARRKCLL